MKAHGPYHESETKCDSKTTAEAAPFKRNCGFESVPQRIQNILFWVKEQILRSVLVFLVFWPGGVRSMLLVRGRSHLPIVHGLLGHQMGGWGLSHGLF